MTKRKLQGAPLQNLIIPLLLSGGKLWKGSLLAYIIKDEISTVGYPREGGIQCLCHQEIFSMTNFELHAGSKQKKGSRFIFLLDGSGKSLANLKQELRPCRQKSGDQSSTALTFGSTHENKGKTCNFCSREVELIFCRTPSCPAALHADCLPFQMPSSEWYCQKCTCRLCQRPLVTSDEAESDLLLCDLCGDEYHVGCLMDRGNFCYSIDFKWWCSKDCETTFEVLRKITELTLPPSDPHPVTLLRLSADGDDILDFGDDTSTLKLHTLEIRRAAEATRLFATLRLLEKSFEGMNQSNLFHSLLYPDPKVAFGSTRRVFKHFGFYTFLLEEGDHDHQRVISQVISIAIIRIHGKKVAEMPFIATSEPHRGKGYCTKLMEGLQKILKGIEVRYLVVHSTPEFVAMWTSKHSLKQVNHETKRSLLESNLMKLEGRTPLYKSIH